MNDEARDEPAQPSLATLVAAAQREGARPGRSRVEPWAQVVFILRAKQWSFAAITAWLAGHGVLAAESTVQRFYRSRSRGADPGLHSLGSNKSPRPTPFFDTNHENHLQDPTSRTSSPPAAKPKYNTNF